MLAVSLAFRRTQAHYCYRWYSRRTTVGDLSWAAPDRPIDTACLSVACGGARAASVLVFAAAYETTHATQSPSLHACRREQRIMGAGAAAPCTTNTHLRGVVPPSDTWPLYARTPTNLCTAKLLAHLRTVRCASLVGRWQQGMFAGQTTLSAAGAQNRTSGSAAWPGSEPRP